MSDKTRQSSGGRSLFSRSKHKDKRLTEESRYPADDAASFRSSRHKRESSAISLDRPESSDGGINQMAGVITSIPYDAVGGGSRSPIPVEYLPKGEQMPVRREPLPHHLNKNGLDFHQYPSWDGTSAQSGAHSPGRQPLGYGYGNVTMASTGRQTQYQQWGPPRGSSSHSNNPPNPRYDSYMSSNARGSADNLSIQSGKTSFIDGRMSRSPNVAMPSASSQSSYAASQHSNRDSHRFTKFPSGPPPGQSDPQGGFYFPKPDDDNVVEQMFLQLMQKRGWHNLPEQARRQMMAYPAQK